MARDPITAELVSHAADELLHSGQRPTVDAVRSALGNRGSMTTITRHLQAWWESLGDRLDAVEALDRRPDVPDEIAATLTQVWSAALRHARSALEHETKGVQDAAHAAVVAADARTAAAEEAAGVARANLTTATSTAEEIQARLDALQREHSALTSRLAAAHGEAAALRDERTRLVEALAMQTKAAQQAAAETTKAIVDLREVQSAVETKAKLQLDAERTQAALKHRALTNEIEGLQATIAARDSQLLDAAKRIARLQALGERPPPVRGATGGSRRHPRRGA